MPTDKQPTDTELVAQLNKKLEERDAELVDALKVIDDLKAQLAEKPTGTQYPTLTHEGKTYQVTSEGFTFKGQLITIESLKADKSLVQALLDRNAGVLEELVKPAKK